MQAANTQVLHSQQLKEIVAEVEAKYSIRASDAKSLINRCISKAYGAKLPAIIVDDGVYLVFEDKEELKYSKIKYSKQKTKIILSLIQEEANRLYLKTQMESVIDFLGAKKPYLHAEFSFSDVKNDYYLLFFDIEHKDIVNGVKAYCATTKLKKDRIFIDFTTGEIKSNSVFFKEYKNFISKSNVITITKDISSEIYKKIGKRIWIETKNINRATKTVYIHLPNKTTKAVVEHLKTRIRDIFGLSVVFVGSN